MNFVFYLHDELSMDVFEEKILWFKKRYNLISYKQLLDYLYEGKSLNNACHLTIDDGWLSTYQVIFPIMKKYNIPFTIFVSPEICESGKNFWYKDMEGVNEDIIKRILVEKKLFREGIQKYPLELLFKELPVDDVYEILDSYWKERKNEGRTSRSFINVSELREMHKSGLVEIGAHTMTHPILANMTSERSIYEIQKSVSSLSELIDDKIQAFAYPNGLPNLDFGKREMQAVKEIGIKTAFSVEPGCLSEHINNYSIPRIGSQKRLILGKLGVFLPSLANQKGLRDEIRKFLYK